MVSPNRLERPALAAALALMLTLPALAVGPDTLPPAEPSPAPQTRADPAAGWREIYAGAVLLIKGGDPEAGLAQLLALRLRDKEAESHPDVLNFVAFAHRKMKRYQPAKTFYEAALARDPDHLGALEYYGEWHVETGDIAGAERLLARLRALCGGICEEYRDLSAAILKAAAPKG